MTRTFRTALCLLPLAGLLAACDGEAVEAEAYVDGTTVVTERGAFAVTLWSTDGDVALGENQLWIRVSMPDPEDPTGAHIEGKGIPGAAIDLDAWMPNAEHDMPSEPRITYISDGEYRIDDVVFDHAGVWQLDFDIAVGATIDEDVTFAFTVSDD